MKDCAARHSAKDKGKRRGKRTNKAHFIAALVDELQELVKGFTTQDELEDDQPDKVFMAVPVAAEKLPAGARGLPAWAPSGARNGRGLLPISRAHYTALLAINGAFCEAIVDTGGARSMIDYETAKALGLDIELADANKSFGSFWGPSGSPCEYFGRVKGPVELRFSSDVAFRLPELKIIKHSEPLVLVGTDILMRSRGGWTFTYVGIHPETTTGTMVFNNGSESQSVELVSWPKAVVQLPPSILKKGLTLGRPKNGKYGDQDNQPAST